MGWRALHIDARDTSARLRWRALQTTKGDGRAGVRTDQAQPAHKSVSATRRIRRTLGVAADHRHPQPTEAPQAPDSRRRGLKGGPSGHRAARAAPTPRVTHTSFAEIVATSVATTAAGGL